MCSGDTLTGYGKVVAAAIAHMEAIQRNSPLLARLNDELIRLRKAATTSAEWQTPETAFIAFFDRKNKNRDLPANQFRNMLAETKRIPLRSNGPIGDGYANARPIGHAFDQPPQPAAPSTSSSPTTPPDQPSQREQPQADGSEHGADNDQRDGDHDTPNDEELPELPAAIRDGIEMWHRAMARGERPADEILERAAHDLFSLLKYSRIEYPRLQDASHLS